MSLNYLFMARLSVWSMNAIVFRRSFQRLAFETVPTCTRINGMSRVLLHIWLISRTVIPLKPSINNNKWSVARATATPARIACLMRENVSTWNSSMPCMRSEHRYLVMPRIRNHGMARWVRVSRTVTAFGSFLLLLLRSMKRNTFFVDGQHAAIVSMKWTQTCIFPNVKLDIYRMFGLPVVIWFAINTSITWKARCFAFE